jgi:PAS domain S-box-containing protein
VSKKVIHPSRSFLCAAAVARTLGLFLVLTSLAGAQGNEPKRILILMQEDISWPAFRLINENARTALRPGLPEGSLVFSEHLDRVYFSDPQFQAQQMAGIQRKYANSKIDLIIAVGDVPTDLFPGVPLLYVRTDPARRRPSRPVPSQNVVNLWIALDARKTLEAARQLHPQARQVVVIGSTSVTGKNLLAQVRDQISADTGGLSTIYLADSTFEQICQKVSTLGPESIVLFVSLSRDGSGRPFISAEVVPKISAISGAPVYGVLDTHIGSGAVGGYVVRFAEMGKRAGELGLQMLAGEHPQDETVPSQYLFDSRQLSRWKIPESALPTGSLVLFRQPGIWESYKYYILGAILLCLAEALLIFGLLWQRRKRRKFEQSLVQRVAFEKMLSELSAIFGTLPEGKVGSTIEKSLGGIAGFLKLDRITLYRYSPESRDLRVNVSWHGEGVESPQAVFGPNDLPWWCDLLERRETILLSDLNALPNEAFQEREHLRRMGALSVAIIPLTAGDESHDAISFVSTKRRIPWTGELVERLKLLAAIFSNALARERALDARFRHAAIVESSDDAIVSKNLAGNIVSWNASAQKLFGYSESEAIGKPITLLIPGELREEEDEFLRRLRAGERVQHCETVRITKEGKRVAVSLTISPVRDSVGKITGFSKIVRDITDRKRAEQLLRESEERFRLVADKAPVLIWMSGTDKLCNFFNQGWLNFTGRSSAEEMGNGWVSGVHPDDVQRCVETYSSSFEARRDFEMEYRLRRFDGEYRWIVDYGVPRFESDGSFCGYIGSCVDITERKSSAESLQALSGRLINAHEEERARIARDLHDDFNQRLALQCIDLEQLRKNLPDGNVEEQARLAKMLKQTKAMATDIRSLSHELHSSRLEFIGLVPALSGLCQEISEKYKIAVHFIPSEIPFRIPKDVALCLFRVTQEALSNVVKHSQTENASVELIAVKNRISLRIKDEGRGFDSLRASFGAGLGLVGMTERLRHVGGRLLVQSELNSGTAILAEVPVELPVDVLVGLPVEPTGGVPADDQPPVISADNAQSKAAAAGRGS